MKLHLKYLWIVLVACTLTACMNGGGDLAGKWQLRQYQYADGTSEKVDSVFYNFQKGSFSAICLLKDGGVTTFFGNYSLKGAEISIILLPESVNDKTMILISGGRKENVPLKWKICPTLHCVWNMRVRNLFFENFEIKNKNRRFY